MYIASERHERAMRYVPRNVDQHLLPVLTILYFFSYLDRINIGMKRIETKTR